MASSIIIASIVLACIFGGVLLGMSLRGFLPDNHVNAESKDVVKLGMGLIATMAALVLSLLVASAKSSYDTRRSEIAQLAAGVVVTDRVLAHYGPETKRARDLLKRTVAAILDRVWGDSSGSGQPEPGQQNPGDDLYDEIQALSPQTDVERSLKADALKSVFDLGQTRWLLFAQSGSSIPTPFLIVLVFWLVILFASFGLLAPHNGTILAVLFVSALSVSGALFLILELDQPFQGIIQLSSTPLRNSLAQLGR